MTHPPIEGSGRAAKMAVLVPVKLGLPYHHDYDEIVGTYVLLWIVCLIKKKNEGVSQFSNIYFHALTTYLPE